MRWKTYTDTPNSIPSAKVRGIVAKGLFLYSFLWTLSEQKLLTIYNKFIPSFFSYGMPANSHACGLKTSLSHRITLVGQLLMPDWKMWVVAILPDTISKNMLTQTHVRNKNQV